METLVKPYVDAGYKLEEIAQKLGKKISTVYYYVKKYSPKSTLEVRQESLRELFNKNLSDQEIADILGVSKITVKDKRYKYAQKSK